MSARSDVDAILASVNLPDLISRYVALKKDGREYKGICPFHSERTPSFTVYAGTDKERFHCHGCGVGGDAIDFVSKFHSVGFRDAVAIITDKTETVTAFPVKKPAMKKAQRLTRPAEKADGEPDMHARGWGDPSMFWTYRRPNGDPIFHVARYDFVDGDKKKKVTPQWTMGSTDGGRTWSWGMGHFASPRPMYGLDKLVSNPNAPVLICEGEKATDAAQRLLPDYVTMTWAGGGKAAKYTDFAPLDGRDVILWPDADAAVYPADHVKAGDLMPVGEQVGTMCMVDIAGKLLGLARSVRLIQVKAEPDKAGWDAADIEQANWATDYVASWIDQQAATWSSFMAVNKIDIVGHEQAMAEAFAHRHAKTLRFCHEMGNWLEWDGNRWRSEKTKLAFHFALQIAAEANVKNERSLAKASTAAGVERVAQARREIVARMEDFDRDKWLMATPDGTIDLRTGVLTTSDQSSMITKIASIAPDGECPMWMDFLDQATMSDADMMDYLQRAAGYCLTGSTKEHALFFLYGPGGNGKGVFLNTIGAILGDYATNAPMSMFAAARHEAHPTELARLRGSRLVTAQETEEGAAWAEVKIKSLTGGDKITARFMNRDFFEYLPEFKLMFSGNHKPSLSTVDESIRRRFHMIPFVNKPAKKDPDLVEKLRAEWPGILSWMIDGCLNWQKVGLMPPPSVVNATEEYFEQQNIFASWREECCIVSGSNEDSLANLFSSWKAWAERNGEFPKSSKAFAQDLDREGYRSIKRMNGKHFIGLCVKPKDTSGQWQNRADDDL